MRHGFRNSDRPLFSKDKSPTRIGLSWVTRPDWRIRSQAKAFIMHCDQQSYSQIVISQAKLTSTNANRVVSLARNSCELRIYEPCFTVISSEVHLRIG